jgi:hypothetical protein
MLLTIIITNTIKFNILLKLLTEMIKPITDRRKSIQMGKNM